MNPDTHRFEELGTAAAVEAAYAKGWKVFKIGEKVTVNGTDFAVQDIGPTKLTLRPFGPTRLDQGASVERVMEEHLRVDSDLEELHIMIEDSPAYGLLCKFDRRQLLDQRAAMTVYRDLLRGRIARFEAAPQVRR